MVLDHAEKLLRKAEAGEKLVASERRHVVAYLQSTQPELSNVEMGKLFQVTERVIRLDKDEIRRDLAKLISQDDAAYVVVDIKSNFDRQLRDLEKGKAKSKLGSQVYLNFCKAIWDLEERRVRLLQDIGYYPKNLGTATVESYSFQAIVDVSTGSVNTQAVKRFTADGESTDIIDVTPIAKKLTAPQRVIAQGAESASET